ncbi:MAG TPA: Mur ligase family protein [Patescibacteria group bacterium]
MGDIGLRRAKYFMRLLGNPQNKIKVIHIAGTSGKGSTAHLMSRMLQSQGFNVGLSISPHVFDIRERFQISNSPPNEKLVLEYFNQMLPTIRKMEKTKYGSPTFFEINVALAYLMFAKERLDYAIMETGLGGTLDATNTVTSKNKVCIITKLGLDHTQILGKTISKIASEKAGIIHSKNSVISTQQTKSATKILQQKCQQKNANLLIIGDKDYSIASITPQKTIFNFCPPEKNQLFHKKTTVQKWNKLENIHLGLVGLHQAENCSLALATLSLLTKRDRFEIDEKKLRKSLEKISIAGRFEIKKINQQTIIIDGAHNPQKMEAFTSNLAKIYPRQKFIFLVAFKKGKEYQKMLDLITPLSEKIFLTSFNTTDQDNHLSSVSNEEIAKYLKIKKFKNFEIVPNNRSDILQKARMSLSKEERKKPIVITGSLYLISSLIPELKK